MGRKSNLVHQCEICGSIHKTPQAKYRHKKKCVGPVKTFADMQEIRTALGTIQLQLNGRPTESEGLIEVAKIANNRNEELETLIREKDARIAELEELLKGKSRRKPLNYATRMSVWNVTFGEDIAFGQCYCCKRKVTQQDFEAGHVISVANKGSDHITNLRVVCRKCNLSMGVQDMNVFRDTHFS